MRKLPASVVVKNEIIKWWNTNGPGKYASRREILDAIQKSIEENPKNCYDIMKDVNKFTEKELFFGSLSIFTLLKTLEENGIIESTLIYCSPPLGKVHLWKLK